MWMLHSEYRALVEFPSLKMRDDATPRLPPNVQFTNTSISKQLTEGLKLTKHAP